MSNGAPSAPQPRTAKEKIDLLWHAMNIGRLKRQGDIVLSTVEANLGQATGGSAVPNGDINLGDTWNPPPAPSQPNSLLNAGIGAGILGAGIGIAKLLGVGAATVASGPAAPIVAPIVNQAAEELTGQGTVLKLAK